MSFIPDGFRGVPPNRPATPSVTAPPSLKQRIAALVGLLQTEKPDIERIISNFTLLNRSNLSDEEQRAYNAMAAKLQIAVKKEILERCNGPQGVKALLKERFGEHLWFFFKDSEESAETILDEALSYLRDEQVDIRLPVLKYLSTGSLEIALSEEQIEALTELFKMRLAESFAPREVLVRLPTNELTIDRHAQLYIQEMGDLALGEKIFSYVASLSFNNLAALAKRRKELLVPVMYLMGQQPLNDIGDKKEALDRLLQSMKLGMISVSGALGGLGVQRLGEGLLRHWRGPLMLTPSSKALALTVPDRVVQYFFNGKQDCEVGNLTHLGYASVMNLNPDFLMRLPHPRLLQKLSVAQANDFNMERVEPAKGFGLRFLQLSNCRVPQRATTLPRKGVDEVAFTSCQWEDPHTLAEEIRFKPVKRVTILNGSLPPEVMEAFGQSETLQHIRINDIPSETSINKLMMAPHLDRFRLSFSKPTEFDIDSIIDCLKTNRLKSLALYGVLLSAREWSELLIALLSTSSLEELEIGVEAKDDMTQILEALADNTNLRNLRKITFTNGKIDSQRLGPLLKKLTGVEIKLSHIMKYTIEDLSPSEQFDILF